MKKVSMLLCAGVLMSALCAAVTACNDDSGNGRDESLSLLEVLQSAPQKIVSRETLPEWLNDKLDLFINEPHPGVKTQVFKGNWLRKDVYIIKNGLQSHAAGDAYFGNGEKIVREVDDDFGKHSGNWVLIWEHVTGETVTRSEFVDDRAVAEDEYLFPQLSTATTRPPRS